MLFVAFTDASTATESPIYVNVESVKYLKPAISGQITTDGTILALGGNDCVTVSESVDEVLALIDTMVMDDDEDQN